jgi:hypothetical protein
VIDGGTISSTNAIQGTRALIQNTNEAAFPEDANHATIVAARWKDHKQTIVNHFDLEIYNPCRTAILKISV